MENSLFREARKKWSEIGRHRPVKDLNIELSFYKKMLNIFQIGEFYYFIFYPSKSYLEYVSENVKSVLGYTQEEFTTDTFLENIHPDDAAYFVEFEKRVVAFKMNLPADKLMKYKSQYIYRLKRADGTYIPILQQSVTIQCDEDGAVLRNLVIHTDISTLKPSLIQPTLSFIGLEGEPSFYNAQEEKKLVSEKPLLSKREQEVLALLAQNKTTTEISHILFISPQTVGTHRKNIHNKTKTKTVLELVMKAMEKGWLSLLFLLLPEPLNLYSLTDWGLAF